MGKAMILEYNLSLFVGRRVGSGRVGEGPVGPLRYLPDAEGIELVIGETIWVR